MEITFESARPTLRALDWMIRTQSCLIWLMNLRESGVTIRVDRHLTPSEDGWDDVTRELIIKASIVNVFPNPMSFIQVSLFTSEERQPMFLRRMDEHQQEVHLSTMVVHPLESSLSLRFCTCVKKAVSFFHRNKGP